MLNKKVFLNKIKMEMKNFQRRIKENRKKLRKSKKMQNSNVTYAKKNSQAKLSSLTILKRKVMPEQFDLL